MLQISKKWQGIILGRYATLFLIMAATLLITWKQVPLNNPSYPAIDGKYYKSMSAGDFSHVLCTQSRRIVHPATAGLIARLLSVDLEKAYFITALLSLTIFLLAYLFFLADQTNLRPILAIPILFAPYLFQYLFLHYHPQDLFVAALFMVFLIQLSRNRLLLSCVLLLLLYLTREAMLVLVGFPLLMASLWRKQWTLFLSSLGTTLIGLWLIKYFMSWGQPNIHHLSEPMYLLGKFTFNSFYDFFGIELFVNTQERCIPQFVFSVPSFLPLGLMKQFGFCSFDPWRPLFTINTYLTIFGLGPLLCLFILKNHLRDVLKNGENWLIVALFFGLLSFCIGPAIAPEPFRDLGYAWPAFWLATPVLLVRFSSLPISKMGTVLSLHVLLAWLPTLLGFITDSLSAHRLLVLAGAILINVSAFILIRQARMTMRKAPRDGVMES